MREKLVRFGMMLVVIFFVFGTVLVKDRRSVKQVIVSFDYKMSAAIDAGFVDENFYACVLEASGQQEGTVLTDEQLASIEEVSCAEKGVANIQGVEKLIGLKVLNLNKNQISSVDLSNNVNLESITLSANKLSSIDVTQNTHLKYLYVSSNSLTAIDVSKNPDLVNLHLYENKISTIDLSNNLQLYYLNLTNNSLKTLDISNLTLLQKLYVSGNSLTSINLTNNSKLTDLDLFQNKLTSLDLSNNVNLKYLLVSSNRLSKLDLSNNTLLEKLYATSNKITSLDLSNNTLLVDVGVAFNNFEILDLVNNSKIKRLVVSDNIVQNIDLSPLTSLEVLGTTDYLVVPVYGENFSTQNILNYVPKNISFTQNGSDAYQLYNTFGAVGGYYGDLIEEAGYNSVVDPIISDDVIVGKDGGTFAVQLLSTNILNTSISNYDGIKIFYGLYNLSFMRLTSDKYVIDDVNNVIDVSGDSDEEIKNNLKSSLSGVVYEIVGNKLTLKYQDIIIKEFTLQRISNPTTGSFLIYFVCFILVVSVLSIFMFHHKNR